MSKPKPLAYGVYYHIYNRGNNRQNIFLEERNYRHFLNLYGKYIPLVADTFAYCLLPNHFHLLVRIKTADEQMQNQKNPASSRVLKPSQQFSNLFNAYTKAINKTYHRTGSLFEHPFGRIPVVSDTYFVQLVTYIHRNPQRHGLVDDFREWPYSSYRTMLSLHPTQLKRDEVLEWFVGAENLEAMHRGVVNYRQITSLVEEFD